MRTLCLITLALAVTLRLLTTAAAAQDITVAGTGAFGSSGDGGPATEVQLFQPLGVAFDGAGHLYIADRSNKLVLYPCQLMVLKSKSEGNGWWGSTYLTRSRRAITV